jgi:hypothetical protein
MREDADPSPGSGRKLTMFARGEKGVPNGTRKHPGPINGPLQQLAAGTAGSPVVVLLSAGLRLDLGV